MANSSDIMKMSNSADSYNKLFFFFYVIIVLYVNINHSL